MSYPITPDADLVALYMSETKQPERIVSAFLAFDREPPHRDVSDRNGWSSADVRMFDATAPDFGVTA